VPKLGEDYEVVQNVEAFSFFDTIVGGKDSILYETAGAFGHGETIFITARLWWYFTRRYLFCKVMTEFPYH
jgi:hypothetical protein